MSENNIDKNNQTPEQAKSKGTGTAKKAAKMQANAKNNLC